MTKSSTQTFARNLDWVGVWSSKLWSNLRTGQDGNFDSLGMLSRPLHSCTHALLIFTMLSCTKRRGAAFGQFETTICALHHLHETLSFRMFVFIIPPPTITSALAITSSSSLIRIRKRSCKYRNKIKRITATRHPPDRLTSSLVRKQIPLFIVVLCLGWPGL